MNCNDCIKRIERHLIKDNVQPLIVDAQNRADLAALITQYKVSGNDFIDASKFCKEDEYPNIEVLFNYLQTEKRRIFVTGLSTFLKLKGEAILRDTLRRILEMSTNGHVVVFTYQCEKYLNYSDPRLKQRVFEIDGIKDSVPTFIFSPSELTLLHDASELYGIHHIVDIVEKNAVSKVYVKTKQRKEDYPDSIFSISNLDSPYDILLEYDTTTQSLDKKYGTYEQWNYALQKFENSKFWAEIFDDEFSNHNALDIAFPAFKEFDEDKQWLYFIALKLFGAKNNWCLDKASKEAKSVKEITKQIYLSLLSISYKDKNYETYYNSRKSLISYLKNSTDELREYCNLVHIKGRDAIYYLTDNTQKEKELILQLLDQYADSYTKEEIYEALKLIYPALYQYLSPYHFKNNLLDNYFQNYKYQKVINHIFPEFDKLVTEQASKRDYNLILEPRSSKIEKLDRNNTQLYFVDAMGVEYLSYITSVCNELHLLAKVIVCRCELPSITCNNKEFLDLFSSNPSSITNIKDLDEIKHHGKDNFDYQKTKTPIYLIKELEIIHDLLEKIRDYLSKGTIKKAVIMADHGASRLAVIHETECVLEMPSKGEHSGRCCLKTDVDVQPEYATDAGEYWALANYDRFKGGRKANVEVHGGATLEEVTVPIIELTYLSEEPSVYLVSEDDSENPSSANYIPEITVSFRKKARIYLFVTGQLQNIRVSVDGKFYDSVSNSNGYYTIEMPAIKRAKTYSLDVYSGETCIAKDLQFKVKKEGTSEVDLF